MNDRERELSRDLWNAHASRHAGDLYAQVRRTVNGRPVDDEQIDMIVSAVVAGLDLQSDDVLLDLCCGNGFLSDRFFARCAGGVGVDFSEVLIATAKEHFELSPGSTFVCSDVLSFVSNVERPQQFSKIVSYGSLQYIADAEVAELLTVVHERFTAASRFMVGNHLDREKAREFFYESSYVPGIEEDTLTALGRWRSKEEFSALARSAGWRVRYHHMPSTFYGAAYRFDAVLERA